MSIQTRRSESLSRRHFYPRWGLFSLDVWEVLPKSFSVTFIIYLVTWLWLATLRISLLHWLLLYNVNWCQVSIKALSPAENGLLKMKMRLAQCVSVSVLLIIILILEILEFFEIFHCLPQAALLTVVFVVAFRGSPAGKGLKEASSSVWPSLRYELQVSSACQLKMLRLHCLY